MTIPSSSGRPSPPTPQLTRLLGGPDIAWLVARVRRRLELGQSVTGHVTLTSASEEERRAIALLLGRRPASGGSVSVSLDEVDRVLRSSGACPSGLIAAVELVGGPIIVRPDEEAQLSALWDKAFSTLAAATYNRPALTRWLEWLESNGLVKRLIPSPVDARPILEKVALVIERLPAQGIPLGRLAAETCHDAHALDEARPVGTLALSAIRFLASTEPGSASLSRRDSWASVGVVLDELSSTVLSIGLPGDSASPVGQTLAVARNTGEPCVLTLRQLRRHTGSLRGGLVRICENPIVVSEAAKHLGPAAAPLVCVNGMPSDAVWRLLEMLAEDGAEFAYHGDFDWSGIGIATAVYNRVGWHSWRFDAAAYSAAPGSLPLKERPGPTPWDPALSAAMSARGILVEEELVLDDLLRDLAG